MMDNSCQLCDELAVEGSAYCPDCQAQIEEANASFTPKAPVDWAALFAATPTRYTEKQIKADQRKFAPRPFSILK